MHSPTLGAHLTVSGKDWMYTNNSLELLRQMICLKVKMDIGASFQTVKDCTIAIDENEWVKSVYTCVCMYHPVGLCTAAATKEEGGIWLTQSCQHGRSNQGQLCTEWQQHTVRAVTRMGERLFFKQNSNILTAFQKRKGLTSQRLTPTLVSTLSSPDEASLQARRTHSTNQLCCVCQ